jgi:hypothetical protein
MLNLTMKGQTPFLAAVPPASLSLANVRDVGTVSGPLPHAGAACLPKLYHPL